MRWIFLLTGLSLYGVGFHYADWWALFGGTCALAASAWLATASPEQPGLP
jgi:hypothetical protein